MVKLLNDPEVRSITRCVVKNGYLDIYDDITKLLDYLRDDIYKNGNINERDVEVVDTLEQIQFALTAPLIDSND